MGGGRGLGGLQSPCDAKAVQTNRSGVARNPICGILAAIREHFVGFSGKEGRQIFFSKNILA